MNSAAVIGRQLRQQNRAPGPLAVPGRPRAPSHVNLGPLPASVTAASSPHKDSSANKHHQQQQQQEDDEKQHSLIPAYVSLGCVWKFAKALSLGVLLIAIGTAMCVVGFLAEQLSTSVTVVDATANITTTTVDRSMEYHLHNLSFAGPAIMGLGGICIVAACVLTFGVKDHHHRVVPVDEKRPSIGEALVPILPLPPKGRRRPKPPASDANNVAAPAATTSTTTTAAAAASTTTGAAANAGGNSTTTLNITTSATTAVNKQMTEPTTCNSSQHHNNRGEIEAINEMTSYDNPYSFRTTTTRITSSTGGVAEERRKSSAVAGSKTTTIVPTTRSSDSHRNSVSTDRRTSSSSSSVKPIPAAVMMRGTGAVPERFGYSPDYPERYSAGSALSAAGADLSSVSGCSTPASHISLPQMSSGGRVWTCPLGTTTSTNYYSSNQQFGGSGNNLAAGPSVRSSQVSHQAAAASEELYYNSTSGSSSSSNSVPPSSLNIIPLHTRTGATPPFKMRPAPSLSTSSTCTNFLLSPQYESTFIPSPTDFQILDPDGCDTPSSSSKSFYMSRSASTSSGLHLDMYLNRLPVSLRMQLSSKLFASMESDGLSSISTSENDIQTANEIVLRDFKSTTSSSTILKMKRTSFNSNAVSNNNNNTSNNNNNNNNSNNNNNISTNNHQRIMMQMGNSRTTSNEDSQEVTPLLAEEEDDPDSLSGNNKTGQQTDTTSSSHSMTGGGGGGSSSSSSSYDRRFPLLRQAAAVVTESSRGLNGNLAPATAQTSRTISPSGRRAASSNATS